MKKSLKLSIIIIIILLLVIGFLIYQENFEKNHILVGTANFEIPEGFQEGHPNKLGDINLTNGTNSIFLSAKNDTNIHNEVNSLKEYFENENDTTQLKNFTISDKVVYKLTVSNDTFSSFYWFENNNEVYYIYNWDGIQDMDQVISNFINKMK